MTEDSNHSAPPRKNRLLFPGTGESHAPESPTEASTKPSNQITLSMQPVSVQPIAPATSAITRSESAAKSATSQLTQARTGGPNLTFSSPPSYSVEPKQGVAPNGIYITTSDFSVPIFGIIIASFLNLWVDTWICQSIAAFLMLALGVLLLIQRSILSSILFILGAAIIFIIALHKP